MQEFYGEEKMIFFCSGMTGFAVGVVIGLIFSILVFSTTVEKKSKRR
jgi:MFS superfamily sulfate permease-like transporter